MPQRDKSSLSSILSTIFLFIKLASLYISLEHLIFEPSRIYNATSPLPKLGIQLSFVTLSDLEYSYAVYGVDAILAWLSFTSTLKHLWRRADDLLQTLVVAMIFAALWHWVGGGVDGFGILRVAARNIKESLAEKHAKSKGRA